MGLLLGFYAGDADLIGAEFSASHFHQLQNGTSSRAFADFSLNLSPADLDTLSEVIAERVGSRTLLLNDSLVRLVGGSGDTNGASVVDPRWVQIVAAARHDQAADLAISWIEKVGADYGETFEASPEAQRAVDTLIRLCQLALKDNLAVVHTWNV